MEKVIESALNNLCLNFGNFAEISQISSCVCGNLTIIEGKTKQQTQLIESEKPRDQK